MPGIFGITLYRRNWSREISSDVKAAILSMSISARLKSKMATKKTKQTYLMGSWIWRTLLECMIVQLMIPPVAIQALQPCSQLISHHLSPSCLAQKTIRRLLTPEYFYCKTWVFSNSVKFKSMNNCTLWNKWYRNRCSKHAFTYQQHL